MISFNSLYGMHKSEESSSNAHAAVPADAVGEVCTMLANLGLDKGDCNEVLDSAGIKRTGAASSITKTDSNGQEQEEEEEEEETPETKEDTKYFSSPQVVVYDAAIRLLERSDILSNLKSGFTGLSFEAKKRGVSLVTIIRTKKFMRILKDRTDWLELIEHLSKITGAKIGFVTTSGLEFVEEKDDEPTSRPVIWSPLGLLKPQELELFNDMVKMLMFYDWASLCSRDNTNPDWDIEQSPWDIDRKLRAFKKKANRLCLNFKKILSCLYHGKSLIDIVMLYDLGIDQKNIDDGQLFRRHGLLYVIEALYDLGVPIVSIADENPTLETLWKSKTIENPGDIICWFIEHDPTINNPRVKPDTVSTIELFTDGAKVHQRTGPLPTDTNLLNNYSLNLSAQTWKKFGVIMSQRYNLSSDNLDKTFQRIVIEIGRENDLQTCGKKPKIKDEWFC